MDRLDISLVNVLIVDDEPALLEISREFLESEHGMRITTLERSPEALNLILSGYFNAVVSDYQMPEMNGLVLLKEIRSRGLDIPFVLFTGKGREEVAIEALNSGADYYVQKGGDASAQYSDLAHKIRRAVSERAKEKMLRFERERLETILDIYNMADEPEEIILRSALDSAMKLCQGKCGFLALMQRSDQHVYQAYGADIYFPDAATIERGSTNGPAALGPWGEGALDRDPAMANDIENCGHENIPYLHKLGVFRNFISVPILDGDAAVMLIGVGNKESDFDDHDVRQVTLLMNSTWEIVKRKRSENQLAKSVCELEMQQDRLVESETRFRTLFERSTNGIALMKERFLEVNSVFANMLGYAPEEMVGMRAWEVSPPTQPNGLDSASQSKEVIARALTDIITQFEWVHLTKDGRPVDCEVTLQKVVVQGEDLLLALIRDISAIKREQKLRDFFYSISESVQTTTDRDELFQSIYDSLFKLIKLDNFYIGLFDPAEDLVTFPLIIDSVKWHEKQRKGGRGLTEYVLRQNRPVLLNRAEQEMLIEQGEVGKISNMSEEWMGVPLSIEGRSIGMMAAQNYTLPLKFKQEDLDLLTFLSEQVAMAVDRIEAKERLVRSIALLQGTVDSTRDGLIVLDKNFDVLLANRTIHELLRIPNGSLIGRNALDLGDLLLGMLGGDEIPESLFEQMIENDLRVHEHTISTIDGRYFDLVLSPYLVEGRKEGNIWTISDITEKRKIEQELRESETRMKTVVSSAPVGIGIVTDRHFSEVNDRTLKLLGYERDELIGHSTRMLYESDEEYVRVGKHKYQQVREEGIGWEKTRWRKKDGSYLSVMLSTAALDLENEAAGNIFTMTDLTDLEQTQKHLQDRLRYEGLLTTISRLFAQMELKDLDETFLKALEHLGQEQNADRAYVFEFDLEQGTMSNTVEWVREGVQAFKDSTQNVPLSSIPWGLKQFREKSAMFTFDVASLPPEAAMEREMLSAQGITSMVATALYLENEIVGFMGFDYLKEHHSETAQELELLRFIGEMFSNAIMRREREEVVRNERERLTNVLNNAPMGALVFDLMEEDLVLTFSNEASKRLLGRKVSASIGKNIAEAFPGISPELVERFKNCIGEKTRESIDSQYRDERFGGHYQMWTSPLGKRRLAVFFLDITETKLLNDKLSLANKKLTLLSKLTRHDANNKIMTVQGNLDLLRIKSDPKSCAKYIDGAEKGVQDITDIMDTLHYYLGIGTEALGWIDMDKAVDRTLGRLEHEDRMLPNIVVSDDFRSYEIQGDQLMPMVLYNLIWNSIKHGGQVDQIRLSIMTDGSSLQLIVEDNGRGVSEELEAKIFDFDLKGRLGHGLNFIKEVLDIYGMSIEYVGRPGRGAKFVINVPPGQYRKNADN